MSGLRRPVAGLAGLVVMVAAWPCPAMAHAVIAGQPANLPARDYHIDTTLVRSGKPEVIVVSSSRRPVYEEIARRVQARIKELAGVEVQIVDADAVSTTDALVRGNVIALGNLVTSRFVERLYWDWYTLLDLWYPGPGGYVVRTLHDPYGTGRNVVFLGGSDDEGVSAAADVFCGLLAKGEPLKLGRLAEIRLGENHKAPPAGDWIEPRLRLFNEQLSFRHGYVLSYTDASRAGLIYYYNGSPEAANRFRDLALRTDVLTDSSHYTAHMHTLIWDLIEESPAFNESDRREITARLLRHARGPDGTAGAAQLAKYPVETRMLDRHSSMQAICTLVSSRYFGKYWPSDEWRRNTEIVQRYFDRQMTVGKCDSDLSGRGIYTYPECALIPSLLLGDRRIIESGALRNMAELCLMHCDNTGYMPDTGQNSFDSYPIAMLGLCAALLNDGRLLSTMPLREEAERIGGFTNLTMEFTHGQAWTTGLRPQPMEKMVGVYHVPLTPFEHQLRGKAVPIEKSLDKLTMRTGFGRNDQYLLLDGLHGGPNEKPWPNANAVVHFTQNGRIFLVSDVGGENPANHNVVCVSKEGMGELPERAASLESTADLVSFGYSHSRLARHMFSSWDRHIFWRKGGWFVVLDRLSPREEGQYSFECQWRTIGEPGIDGNDYTSTVRDVASSSVPRDVLNIKNAERYPLRRSEAFRGPVTELDTKAWSTYCSRKTLNRVRQVTSRRMQGGDEQVFTNLLYVGGDNTNSSYGIRKVAEHEFAITGDESAWGGLVVNGKLQRGVLAVQGAAFLASPLSLAVVDGRQLRLGETEIAVSGPCSLELDVVSGKLNVEASRTLTVTINGREHPCPAGLQSFSVIVQSEDVKTLQAQIREAGVSESDRTAAIVSASPPALAPAWTHNVGAAVCSLCLADVDGEGRIEALVGVENGEIVCLDADGRQRWIYRTKGAVRTLAFAVLGGRPTVLAGSDDECVYALAPDGADTYWTYRCKVPAERFQRYPWWTTQGKAKVQAILVADLDRDGRAEILVGTGGGCVEALSDAGASLWVTPIEWGIPDRLVVANMPDGARTLLVSNSTFSCADTTWRLSAKGKLLSNNAFDNGRGTWDMAAVPGLQVVDLEDDGQPEAIIGRKGAYNEAAVYDAATGRRRWLSTLADEVGAVEVVDIDGDGVKEVVVGSRSAWLMVFAADGRTIWATQMPHEVISVAAGDNGLLVATADAKVHQVDFKGRIQACYALAGLPTVPFVRAGDDALIGDRQGSVTAISMGH